MKSRNRCAARSVLYQGDVYVAESSPASPHGPEGSIANPFTVIQEALDHAAPTPGPVTVFVGEGTYNLGGTPLTIPSGITLKGAGPHKTIITQDPSSPIIEINDTVGPGTGIQDLTLLGGYDAISINWGSGTPILCPMEISHNIFMFNAYGIRMNRANPPGTSLQPRTGRRRAGNLQQPVSISGSGRHSLYLYESPCFS